MIQHRQEFGGLLNRLGLTGEGVEIGVYRGDFARCILRDWVGRKLHLVDPWKRWPKEEFPDILNQHTQAGFEEIYQLARQNMVEYRDRVNFIRKPSLEAAEDFQDNSLDFVYIDANHSYAAVWSDITAWYPKVRPGGIISGHDYTELRDNNTTIEVRLAVNDFFHSFCNVHVTKEDYPTWLVTKPGGVHIPKRIVRWTVGDISAPGFECLQYSVRITSGVLERLGFEKYICYNNMTPSRLEALQRLKDDHDVTLLNSEEFPPPLPDMTGSTVWKLRPARIDRGSHELCLDNDVILTRPVPEMLRWLATNDRCMILEEPLRALGRYDKYFASDVCLNSGVYGLPPGFHLAQVAANLHEGSLEYSQWDEQGLLLRAMLTLPKPVYIPKTRIVMAHCNGCWDGQAWQPYVPGKEAGLHFATLNTQPHPFWPIFKATLPKHK